LELLMVLSLGMVGEEKGNGREGGRGRERERRRRGKGELDSLQIVFKAVKIERRVRFSPLEKFY